MVLFHILFSTCSILNTAPVPRIQRSTMEREIQSTLLKIPALRASFFKLRWNSYHPATINFIRTTQDGKSTHSPPNQQDTLLRIQHFLFKSTIQIYIHIIIFVLIQLKRYIHIYTRTYARTFTVHNTLIIYLCNNQNASRYETTSMLVTYI